MLQPRTGGELNHLGERHQVNLLRPSRGIRDGLEMKRLVCVFQGRLTFWVHSLGETVHHARTFI
ncbi:MAG: hypothetical protein KDB22_07895 [Planctomycetales bacterium]|nr:hypothetical protein [Planctomycetales bacterium]